MRLPGGSSPSQRRDAILYAVTLAADRFLRAADPLDAVPDVLAAIGTATGVARTHLFEVSEAGERLLMSQRAEWCADGVASHADDPELEGLDLVAEGLGHWLTPLQAGEPLLVDAGHFTPAEHAHLAPQGIKALVIVPIQVEGRWWGSLGCDETHHQRRWTTDEIDALGAAARVLGAGIEQHRTAAVRREEQARLTAALRREQQAGDRLRELDELRTRFVTAVSHELRTPLTAISGFAQTLQRRDPDLDADLRRELLARLTEQARHLEGLLGDLLDLGLASTGELQAAPVPTELRPIVERAVAGIPGLAPSRVDRNLDVAVALVDPRLLTRILDQLLANAVRHAGQDVHIWIDVTQEERALRLRVEDDGPGVPEALRTAMFDAFRHGPTAPDHAPGTGVGLALVAQLAAAHGGSARLTERPGGGVRCEVRLGAPPDPEAS